jgi:prevent-host-death family protein
MATGDTARGTHMPKIVVGYKNDLVIQQIGVSQVRRVFHSLVKRLGSKRMIFEPKDSRAHPIARPSHLDNFHDQTYNLVMRQIAAAKFKEQCLALLDEVDQEGIVITKHGKPVATLIPFGASSASLIGALRGKLVIKGEIVSTGIKWRAQR